MPEYIDISLTVTNQLVTWPGDPSVDLERVKKIENGANANVSQLNMGVHTGTHVDAPVHFIPGQYGIDALSLETLIGPVQVVQLPDSAKAADRAALNAAGIQPGVTRVLIKTSNSQLWAKNVTAFQPEFVGVSKDGAEFLVEKGIKLVGIDYLSIAPYKQSRPTHEVLLAAKLIVLEGINLTDAQPGMYTLLCLPVKLGGSDGAPARAVLVK
jgi:arylformamidase